MALPLHLRRSMRDVCDYLSERVPEILVEWNALAAERPWHDLPETHRLDSLPEVVTGLIEAAVCEPEDRESHRAKVYAAAEHGRQRREQAFDDDLLLTEYYLMREAIWRVLRREESMRSRSDAILLIDGAMNLATRASLAGYHQPEYEARGRWPRALEELVDQSPLLRK